MQDFAREILAAHNAVRAVHGAPALVWDSNCALAAERWAESTADSGRFLHSGHGLHGENMALINGAVPSGRDIAALWYAESADYNYSNGGLSSSAETGHFTQMIWASSRAMGASIVRTGDSYVVVAHYVPAGNAPDGWAANVAVPRSGSVSPLALPRWGRSVSVRLASGRGGAAAGAAAGAADGGDGGDGGSGPLADMKVLNANGKAVHTKKLRGKFLAFYFGALWCKPCVKFTPVLAEFHATLAAAGSPFELIFISADHDEDQMHQFLAKYNASWLRVPHKGKSRQVALDRFAVREVPAVVIVAPNGDVVSTKGRAEIYSMKKEGVPASQIFDAWVQAGGGLPPAATVSAVSVASTASADRKGKKSVKTSEPEPRILMASSAGMGSNTAKATAGPSADSKASAKGKGGKAASSKAAKGGSSGGSKRSVKGSASPPASKKSNKRSASPPRKASYKAQLDEEAAAAGFAMEWANSKNPDGSVAFEARTAAGFEHVTQGEVAAVLQPMHVAFRDGNFQFYKTLKSRGVLLFVIDNFGRTPMHYLGMHGGGHAPQRFIREFSETIKGAPNPLFGEWRAMLAVQDSRGNTPLHFAARYGHKALVPYMLRYGAEAVEVRNRLGRRPYDELILNGHVAMLDSLPPAAFPDGVSPLSILPADMRSKLAANEIAGGVGSTTPGRPSASKHQKSCNRALLGAVRARDADTVRRLLETTPANPLAANKDGVSIVDHAIRSGYMDIVAILDKRCNPVKPVNVALYQWESAEIDRAMPRNRHVDADDIRQTVE